MIVLLPNHTVNMEVVNFSSIVSFVIKFTARKVFCCCYCLLLTSLPVSPAGPVSPGGPTGPGGPRSPPLPGAPCLPGSP